MKKLFWPRLVSATVLSVCLLAAAGKARIREIPYCPRLNPQALEAISGEIDALVTVTSGIKGVPDRLAFFLKTPQERLLVCLGPLSFIEEQGFRFREGKVVKVVGSRTIIDNIPAMVAKEVNLQGKILRLRDDQGTPLWQLKPGEPH